MRILSAVSGSAPKKGKDEEYDGPPSVEAESKVNAEVKWRNYSNGCEG